MDYTGFDFLWQPVPWESHYRHAWPSQHQPDSETYLIPTSGWTETRYHPGPILPRSENLDNWTVPENVDPHSVDYTWHPNPLDPPYIYEFATQWYTEGGPRYSVAGATSIKYIDHPCARLMAQEKPWHVLFPIDRASFDWSWAPHPREEPYVYVWGNQHWPGEKMATVEYHVPGATQRKYMPGGPRLLPQSQHWTVPEHIDPASVDMTWCPDPGDPPYIYEFATQWQPNGGARYTVPGGTEIKYVDNQTHLRQPCLDCWTVHENIDQFDHSWHPDNTEEPYIYVFGNQHYPAEIMPTLRYTVPGATKEKFLDQPKARLSQSRENWEIHEPINEDAWDWSWRPNPCDPPYIYVFGNQWNRPELKPSVRYVVPGATEIKYVHEPRTQRLPCPDGFEVKIPISEFDFSWEPNPFDPAYVYVFGNQWNPAVLEPTVVYTAAGATEIKYVDEIVATVAPDPASFELMDEIKEFDFSWRPNPTDPPYVYVFGNQWLLPEQRPALKYTAPGATDVKYMTEPRAHRASTPEKFITHFACEFDYSWEPDPGSPAYNYVFGNQWWPAEIMPTVEYKMPDATEVKYMDEPRAVLSATSQAWHTPTDLLIDFDFSWCPDPGDPPYVYVFGNQWHSAEVMPTVEYHVPGATTRKFMDSPIARTLPDRTRWNVPEEVSADNIDFSWIPDPGAPPYVYHFGTDYQTSVGLTYTVPGATDLKFAGDIPRLEQQTPAVVVLEIFYLDHSNAASTARFKALQQRYPHAQKVRYVGSMLDTVKRCVARAKGSKFWVISSRNDYTDFDFAWHAQPWQTSMTHVFGTQWNKWSDTFLINRWEFERHCRWAQGIEQFPNLNFVSDQQVMSPSDATDIFVIDHGNPATLNYLSGRYRVVRSVRYFDNYLDTLARIISQCETEYAWVVSGLCDYSWFDFSWQPEAWQQDMLHVFPSNEQKFGDTFYVPVQRLREQLGQISRLDCFETVNFCADQTVPRWPVPVMQHDADSHVDAVLNYDQMDPLMVFSNRSIDVSRIPTVSMWDQRTRTIVPLDTGAGAVIVPKSAVAYVNTQLYDYPYIDKTHKDDLRDTPLDVVFISNGESNAEQNWERLQQILANRGNRLHRVDGITGRVQSYQACARISTTPWYFMVPAKLEVSETFDWNWLPDRMQQPKHYIFFAHNPVTKLDYGHMATVAANRQLVLNTIGHGLDFTMEQPHEVVPLLSGTARYNDHTMIAWRTAFRECIKLKNSLPNVENEYRLNRWLSSAEGKNGEWSQRGAEAAVEYYDSVQGDFESLRLSFEWKWIDDYFDSLYKRADQ